MEDEANSIVEKVQELGDIELALLLSLIAEEHCIIQAEANELDKVEQELRLICSKTFGLTHAVLDCSEDTTLEDFGSAILLKELIATPPPISRKEDSSFPRNSKQGSAPRSPDPLRNTRIAEAIIAKNLNATSSQVQIQALELIRSKRIFSRTAVHTTPKRFLFISLQSVEHESRLNQHLNDRFFISHSHETEDGLPNLEGRPIGDDDSSSGSVVRSPPPTPGNIHGENYVSGIKPMIGRNDIDTLMSLSSTVRLSSDVRGYLHDVVVFMRMHRAVAAGVSALATRHFHALARALAPLHEMDYVTPSLVSLAARKIYPHRLIITTPENERSTQWGSSVEAVAELLDGITVDDVIEDVLQTVQAPL